MNKTFLSTPGGDRSLAIIHSGSIATVKALPLFEEAGIIGFDPRYIHATPAALPFFVDSILRETLQESEYRDACKVWGTKKSISQKEVVDLLTNSKSEKSGEIASRYVPGEADLSASFGRGVRDIKHITCSRVASLLVAPASANILGKIANGITDTFALEMIRAFDPNSGGRVFLAPAMNTQMLKDPAIQKVFEVLKSEAFSGKYHVLDTVCKTLACGENGDGAMLDPRDIFQAIQKYYQNAYIQPGTQKIYGPTLASRLSEDAIQNIQTQYLEKLNGKIPGFPLQNYAFQIPSGDSQNAFGGRRKVDIHTGIDLFGEEGQEVYSMTDGVVTQIIKFTGPDAIPPTPWWHNTDALLVKTNIGTILYGEVTPEVQVGDTVKVGQTIGRLKKVIDKPEDFPYPPSMLHIELYDDFPPGSDAVVWNYSGGKTYDHTSIPIPEEQPKYLLNPLYLLELARSKNKGENKLLTAL